MSTADDVTTDAGAQPPASVGAACAVLSDRKPMQPVEDANRDRSSLDADIPLRSRNEFGPDTKGDVPMIGCIVAEMTARDGLRVRGMALIRSARDAVRGVKTPSLKSQADYTRKSDRLLVKIEECGLDEVSAWEKVLMPYAPSSNSFFAMRAAASWRARQNLRKALSDQCRTQRQEGLSERWLTEIDDVARTLDTLNIIDDVTREELLEMSGDDPRPVRSKRLDLKRLPKDWRRRLVDHAQSSPTYGSPLSVLEVTGCRPAELARGVSVTLDGRQAVISIRGAKVGESSGQELREMRVNAASLAPGLRDETWKQETAWVGVWSTAALRSALRTFGDELWPKGPTIVPYHFRHALAEDLRENGWEAAEIGAALGHRVSETAAAYGRKRRPGQRGGGTQPVSVVRGGVKTSVPVRPLRPFDHATLKTPMARLAESRTGVGKTDDRLPSDINVTGRRKPGF